MDKLQNESIQKLSSIGGRNPRTAIGYTKENKQIVYFILNRFQMNKLKEIIREIDEKAFISFEEVSEISHNVEI